MHVPLTPLRFLERSEDLYRDSLAVACGGEEFTYARYGERVRRAASMLRALGVGRGDRVVYLGMNCHRLLELYFANLPLEAILVPVNVRLAPAEIAYVLADAAPRVLVVSPELLPLVAAVPVPASVEHRILAYAPRDGAIPAGYDLYDDLLERAEPMRPFPHALDENSVVEIFYTSGTTARPRGVMLSARALYLHALESLVTMGLTDADRSLVGAVPLFHVNGWGNPQTMVAIGGAQVLVPRFEAESFCATVERYRCTLAMMVPTMLAALLDHPGRAAHDVSSLRKILLGGAPPPQALLARARQALTGTECLVGYGLTETAPVVSVANVKASLRDREVEEQDRVRSLTGLPAIGILVRVVHEDGTDVRHDGEDVGEILVRSDHVMEGYWHLPDETARALAGGYLATGDLAVVDADGYLNIVDRKKDIIISGGENIASVEIEDALYRHPAVLEAAVVAGADERWGEVPVAFVALRPGTTVDAEELGEYARTILAHFKVPHHFVFLPELPKTGTGKIQKALLRQRWRDDHPAA